MSVILGSLELCLLTALCLGVGSETLSARVWQPSRPDFQLPESFEGSLNLESKLNFGIALAGGGMRGGALGHGVLRTLREAKLLEKARYLSVTSGSVWLGLPLYYQAIDTVEEYLGQTLRPEDMTPVPSMASADTVQQALDKLAETFQNEDKSDLAKLTRHVLSLLKHEDTRAKGVEAVIQLQDQLHIARRLGNYIQEANLVEAIAGRMRTDDAYGLESSVPMVQAEQSDEMKALIKQMQEADLKSRPYEFLNTADSEEMTVNISVPADTQMKDVSVKLSAKTIRVEIKGHEMQPCVIDGSFFQAVDPAGCDHHLEGSGAKRLLVIDLEKKQNGLKWPDLLGYGAM